MKFTFKKAIPQGRWRSFEPESHEIKLNKKVVGIITELRDRAFKPIPKEDWGKHRISFAIKTGCGAGFKWVYMKRKFETAEEARAFVKEHAQELQSILDFHMFED